MVCKFMCYVGGVGGMGVWIVCVMMVGVGVLVCD